MTIEEMENRVRPDGSASSAELSQLIFLVEIARRQEKVIELLEMIDSRVYTLENRMFGRPGETPGGGPG